MIKIVAPEGYKIKDIRTGKLHSEVVTDEQNRKHFELVPDNQEEITEYTEV